jgi:hypothetical protein
MSSSSRSIAAARQKRAGEQAPMINNSRPVTSISSQSAFAQQQQYQQQYQQQQMNQNIPVSGKNVRAGISGRGSSQAQQLQQSQQDQSTKISVSNAIGLITLRLGRLENIVNDAIEDGGFDNNNDDDDDTNNGNTNDNHSIPSNMKLVSDEVFENIVNRLNLLESKVINFTNQNEVFVKELSNVQSSIVNLSSTLNFFINETNEKFIDYENALAEMEQNFEVDPNVNYEENGEENENKNENEIGEAAEISETNGNGGNGGNVGTSETNENSEN